MFLRFYLLYLNHNIRKALKEKPPGPFCLEHARLLSGFYCDRQYIDIMLEHAKDIIEPSKKKMWAQAYMNVGLTMCDLGYSRDGISYIEKAISLEERPDFKNRYILLLCYRLSNEACHEKLIELAKTLVNDEPQNPLAKIILVKAYIDDKRFDEAKANIEDIVKENPKAFGFLFAELYFSLKDYKAASDAFDKYDINRKLYFWLPEYDYKKAAAYYYSGQQEKVRKQDKKIRRRMKWDRFYRLNGIEKFGIEKIPAIDEMIESGGIDNIFIDTEKISHYFKTIQHLVFLYIKEKMGI